MKSAQLMAAGSWKRNFVLAAAHEHVAMAFYKIVANKMIVINWMVHPNCSTAQIIANGYKRIQLTLSVAFQFYDNELNNYDVKIPVQLTMCYVFDTNYFMWTINCAVGRKVQRVIIGGLNFMIFAVWIRIYGFMWVVTHVRIHLCLKFSSDNNGMANEIQSVLIVFGNIAPNSFDASQMCVSKQKTVSVRWKFGRKAIFPETKWKDELLIASIKVESVLWTFHMCRSISVIACGYQ